MDEDPRQRWSQDDIDEKVNGTCIDHPNIAAALQILIEIGLPRTQQNDRSALTLLALLDLQPDMDWKRSSAPLIGITPVMDWMRRITARI